MCAPLRRSASQPYSSSRCPSSSRDLPGEHPGDHPGDHQLLQRPRAALETKSYSRDRELLQRPRAALETESYSRDRELLQRPRAALETKSYSGDRELLQSAASGLSTRHQPQPQPATPRHRTPNLWWRLRKHLLRTCFAPAAGCGLGAGDRYLGTERAHEGARPTPLHMGRPGA